MTDKLGNLYFYHPASNTVTKFRDKITYDQFVHEEQSENSFWSAPRDDLKMEVYGMDDEMILLSERPGQTEEQVVILFATMLGLRETAQEELVGA